MSSTNIPGGRSCSADQLNARGRTMPARIVDCTKRPAIGLSRTKSFSFQRPLSLHLSLDGTLCSQQSQDDSSCYCRTMIVSKSIGVPEAGRLSRN
jgi:hypothetical protein